MLMLPTHTGEEAEDCGVPMTAQESIVPVVLHCPHCRKQHVDEGAWATKPHRTHACVDDVAGKGCGKAFTPSAYRTVGVLAKDLVFEVIG